MKDTQLLAWALDRAIETLKLDKEAHTPQEAMDTAESFVNWIASHTAPDTLPEANAEAPSEVQ